MSFFPELKRRNVFKVGAAYAIVGWLLVQVADTVFPRLLLPDWTVTFVAAVIILGFPIALLLSWAFELTPEGVKPTRNVPIASSVSHVTGQRLNYVVTSLLALALTFLFVDRHWLDGNLSASRSGVLENSIAVLPFANLSPNPDEAYFAAGIHEEILNQLAKLRGLNVISRTSVMRYADNPPPISYSQIDHPDDAARLMTDLENLDVTEDYRAPAIALGSIALGDYDRACELLQRAIIARSAERISLGEIKANYWSDPVLDGEPRFRALRDRLGADQPL